MKASFEEIVFCLVACLAGFLVGGFGGAGYTAAIGLYIEKNFPETDNPNFQSYGATFFLSVVPLNGVIGGLSGCMLVYYFLTRSNIPVLAMWTLGISGAFSAARRMFDSYHDSRSEYILILPSITLHFFVMLISSILMMDLLVTKRVYRFSIFQVGQCVFCLCVTGAFAVLVSESHEFKPSDYQTKLLVVFGLLFGLGFFLEYSFLTRSKDETIR